MPPPNKSGPLFRDALPGLRRGDLSRLEPLFDMGKRSLILEWHELGLFCGEPEALAEAFSCACFLGKTEVAESLLDRGVDPLAGSEDRHERLPLGGKSRPEGEIVDLLIRRGVPFEAKSSYGGTVLRAAIWSSIYEPRADHLAIIEALVRAGASLDGVEYPTGNERVDEVLRRGDVRRSNPPP